MYWASISQIGRLNQLYLESLCNKRTPELSWMTCELRLYPRLVSDSYVSSWSTFHYLLKAGMMAWFVPQYPEWMTDVYFWFVPPYPEWMTDVCFSASVGKKELHVLLHGVGSSVSWNSSKIVCFFIGHFKVLLGLEPLSILSLWKWRASQLCKWASL